MFCCLLLQWVLKGNMGVSEDPTRTKMVKLEKSIKTIYILQMKAEGNLNSFFC